MAKKKKYKRMTLREKKLMAELRAEMRAEGTLPPVKKRLNRYKFSCEVQEEWKKDGDIFHLARVLGWFLPPTGYKDKITPEQIGVLKMLKMAIEDKKFGEELEKEGKARYTVGDYYTRVIKPIKDL